MLTLEANNVKFNVGDVVKLKSGSAAMTVVNSTDDETSVVWSKDLEIRSTSVTTGALVLVPQGRAQACAVER